MGRSRQRTRRRRYGAILWEASAGMEDAIRVVRSFDDPNEAVRSIAVDCGEGESWAVVDLTTLSPVAKGEGRSRTHAAL